jgi:general secretion pathway protein G
MPPPLPAMPRQVAGGFTLVELVVVVAIVGILAAAVFPLADLVARRGRESELREALRTLRGAIDAYKKASDEGRIAKAADASGYPPSLEVLVSGVPDASKAGQARIYILRRLPRDPMAPDRSVPAAETWGKRSYASPPDAPEEGKDVFDVYSRSEKAGLNDVPYREW